VNVAETILVFVGAPLAIFLVLALLIFVPGGRKRPRYRPGQPWDHAPVWYEPHPQAAGDHGPTTHGAHAALESGAAPAAAGPLGGARGTW
jgi:hypothetical protein